MSPPDDDKKCLVVLQIKFSWFGRPYNNLKTFRRNKGGGDDYVIESYRRRIFKLRIIEGSYIFKRCGLSTPLQTYLEDFYRGLDLYVWQRFEIYFSHHRAKLINIFRCLFLISTGGGKGRFKGNSKYRN